MEAEREEWDGPWKEALDGLPLVFELFWPDVLAEVDLGKGWTPLQQVEFPRESGQWVNG
ncbi:MAG: hypothetical protein ACRC33_24590 [Gemmataceae bacterium]